MLRANKEVAALVRRPHVLRVEDGEPPDACGTKPTSIQPTHDRATTDTGRYLRAVPHAEQGRGGGRRKRHAPPKDRFLTAYTAG